MWTDIGIEDAASANTDGLCIIDCVKVGEIVLKVEEITPPRSEPLLGQAS